MNGRKRRKRVLNVEVTLENYISRIRGLPRDILLQAEGAYLGTFDVYNTISSQDACSRPLQGCSAIQLMRCLREMGVGVQGVTSERKRNHEYICQELLNGDTRENALVLYVGPFNFFTNHQAHEHFSVQTQDKVYQSN